MKLTNSTASLINRIGFTLALAVFMLSPAGRLTGWSQESPSINDLFAQIGNRVAAFGGLYVDPDQDTVYVYMVPSQAGDRAALDQAMTDILAANRPPESHVIVIPGQYTFLQLKNWQDYSDPYLLSLPGVVSTGVHHSTNRLEVGVSSPQAESAVLAEFAILGIPLQAVEVVPEKPSRTESPSSARESEAPAGCLSIVDKCRPVVGGLYIEWIENPREAGLGTLGFNATQNGHPGFVTCSHCAKKRFENSGTVYFQNQVGDAQIGKEDKNPPLTNTLGAGFKCPEGGAKCRLTETAFAAYDEGVAAKVGYIARPNKVNSLGKTCETKPEYCAWNGTAYFRIVGYRISFEGENVAKVGMTTGLTLGKVTGACRNNADTGAVLVCQVTAKYLSDEGDSGSPVFGCPSDYGNVKLRKPCSFEVAPDAGPTDVHLLGIHWGGPVGGGEGNRFYSNAVLITNPVSELGPLTKFCAPEVYNPSCN